MLEKTTCYLSGPISYVDVDWRGPLLDVLNNFNINVFDPFRDPKQQWVAKLEEAKVKGDVKTYQDICRKFVRKDLAIVDRCDFVVAYLPYKVPTVGTHHEIINANNSKKPTLLFCPTGIFNIPPWYWGFIDPKYFFAELDHLETYLMEVDNGLHKDDFRWSVAYGDI